MPEAVKKGFCVILFFVVIVVIIRAFPGDKEEPEPITLSNGLKVILVPNPSTPVFTSTAVIKTGVINEDAEISGAAHLLEHMLFNGTTRRTQKELYDEVDALGAYNNAFTRDTFTCFQFLCASKDAFQALDIQSDMLFNSTLPEEKLEKEKGIVREEIGKDASRPSTFADDTFRERLFRDTPLSRSALGTEASITGITRERLLNYYKTYYVPNNALLLLMGDFDPKTILEEVSNTFGVFGKGRIPRPAPMALSWPEKPVFFTRNHKKAGVTRLDIGMPAPQPDAEDCVPLIFLSAILDSGFRSGLKTRLGSEAGIEATAAGVSYELQPRGLSHLRISIEMPEESDPAEAVQRVAGLLEETAAMGVLEDEIDAAKRSLAAEESYNLEKPHYYSMFKAALISAAPYSLFSSYEARLRQCTAQQVNQAAKRLLSKSIDHMVAVASGPSLEDTAERTLDLGPLEEATASEPATGLFQTLLPSGLNLVVSETPATQVFAVHVLVKDRSMREPSGQEGIADFVHRMLPAGTRTRDRALLEQELDEIGAHLKVTDYPFIPFDDYYFSPEYSYVRFETLKPYWEKGLRILADILLNPAFPPEEIEKVRAEMMVALQRSERSPSAVAKRLLSSLWLEEGPGSRPIRGTAASVGGVKGADLERFHRAYFDPSNMIVSVVGGIPAEQVKRLVEKLFVGPRGEGSDRGVSLEAVAVPKARPLSGRKERAAELGLPQSYIYIGVPLPITRTELAAASVANAALSNRLAFELREKRGMAYSIGSSLLQVGGGEHRLFLIRAGMGTKGENLQEAEKGILHEMDMLVETPPQDAEVERVKNKLIGRLIMRSLSSEQKAFRLGLAAFRDEPPGHLEAFVEEIEAVTPSDVSGIAAMLKARPGSLVAVVK